MKYATRQQVEQALSGGKHERNVLYDACSPLIDKACGLMGLNETCARTSAWKIFEYALKTFDLERKIGFETYLVFCLKRSIRRMVRNEIQRERPSVDAVEDISQIADLIAGHSDALDDKISLELAISSLPAEEKEVFCLKNAGYKPSEIARIQNEDKKIVLKRYDRAIELLREMLKDTI